MTDMAHTAYESWTHKGPLEVFLRRTFGIAGDHDTGVGIMYTFADGSVLGVRGRGKSHDVWFPTTVESPID